VHTGTDPGFGVLLTELRRERGWSLRQLGRAVPCSHVHVHDLENGRKQPSPELAARLDSVLGTNGSLLALASGDRRTVGEPWRPRAAHFGRTDAEAMAVALVTVRPSPANALRLAHEWMVAEPPQVYELRAGRRISLDTVAAVQQRVHQLRLLDDHVGGADSYAVVTGELAATATLLREASYTEAVGRRLLAVIGELAQVAGWVSSDAGRYAHAQHYFLTGARAAQAGGDIATAANNLSCLAYQMANVGNRADAVVLARTAACRADGVAATVRALLAERVAWAHARAGEAGPCERALDDVEDAYTSGRTGDDPLWAYWLDETEISVMAGRCWTELARPLRAVPTLRCAIAGYSVELARETCLYLTWLAEALVQAREVEEAAATGLRALELSSNAGSPRAGERVVGVRESLRPWRGVGVVDEFEEAYRLSLRSGASG